MPSNVSTKSDEDQRREAPLVFYCLCAARLGSTLCGIRRRTSIPCAMAAIGQNRTFDYGKKWASI
jgi:hypothetical protein